ncbi:hypothetical protein [Candidatus Xianfuyuplasma coldseepsis]|uniref:PTS EIIC type-2 domain-containing protein n=1 Tax=Candidatus Xianfuyuplasma coldseepsis TaxID=2782163 RepID=A0A7L7KQ82_9MOLU|nr:hypothetical protein [Xianfuyuplasma coldseepsis]QMS84589.1 hypothetical protein G4Z02_02095 [Xianfuyuplasma coldseepsis]
MNKIFDPIIAAFRIVVPVIILYSISLAIDTNLVSLGDVPTWILWTIVPLLTAAIAHAIKPWILLPSGLLIGILINPLGVGIFGGIFAGLILGYSYLYASTHFFRDKKPHLYDIKGVITLLLITAMTYVLMTYLIAPPIVFLLDQVNTYVAHIGTEETLLIVVILAMLNTIDLGGPFNKLSFGFAVQFYTDGYYHITGPLMVSVVIPPMVILCSLLLFKKYYTTTERGNIKWLVIGSLFGLTETSLPIALKRPHMYIPILLVGAVIGSASAVLFGIENILLVVSLPGIIGVNYKLLYIVSHVIGVGTSLVLLALFIRSKTTETE